MIGAGLCVPGTSWGDGSAWLPLLLQLRRAAAGRMLQMQAGIYSGVTLCWKEPVLLMP